MVNPYESPQGTLGKDDARPQVRRGLPPHFTHITVDGCNLLGLANLFLFFGLVAIMVVFVPPPSPLLARIVLGLGVCCCTGLDLALRTVRKGEGLVMRLLSPHAGGASFFVPIWVLYPAMTAIGVAAVLLQRSR